MPGTNPFTAEILREQCEHCTDEITGERKATPDDHLPSEETCPRICPHRCFHLKTLNRADIEKDPSWNRALLCAPGRTTIAEWSDLSIKAFARSTNQVILRWRNPLTNSSLERLLTPQSSEKVPGLWEKFLVGAPILITFNLNVSAGLANGKSGVLIRAVHKLPSPGKPSIQEEINSKGCMPGDTFTLAEPPVAVYVQIFDLSEAQKKLLNLEDEETEYGVGPIVPILIGYSGTRGKVTKVNLGKDRHNNPVEISVIDSGYSYLFGTTIHSIQGTDSFLIIIYNDIYQI
jgi:hypothetical protein